MAQNQPAKTDPVDPPLDNAPDPTAEEALRTLNSLPGDDGGKPADTSADKKEPAPPEFIEDPRVAITKSYRENRGAAPAATGDEELDPNSLAAVYGSDAVTTEQQPAAQPAADLDPNRKVKVKVNGQEMEVPLSDVLANYQKVQAGDLYLRKAKEQADLIVNSAKAIAGDKPAASTKADDDEAAEDGLDPSTSQSGKEPSTPKGAKFDRDKLAKTVEAIAFGSTEEGVEALTELLEAAQPKTTDISTQVEVALANRELVSESVDATSAFLSKYPDLAQDPILKNVSGELMAQEMVKDFQAMGLSNEEIAKLAPDRATLKQVYDQVRIHKPEFGRPMADLFKAVEGAAHFQKLVGGAPGAPKVDVTVDRGQRKVLLQQQPALRNPPPLTPSSQQQPLSREQGMARGFAQIAGSRAGGHQASA